VAEASVNSEINWTSDENYVLLNPKFPWESYDFLLNLVYEKIGEFKGHVFILSSGTTSNSVQDLKWVALSKSAILAAAEAVNNHIQSTAADIWLHGLPEFHVGGVGVRARAFLSGARVVPFSSADEKWPKAKWPEVKWNEFTFAQAIEMHRATLTSLVPAQIYDLVHAGRRCPTSMRVIFVGGGALSPSLYREALNLGWPLLPTYGMTETCSQVATAELATISNIRNGIYTGPGRNLPTENPPLKVLPHLEVRLNEDGRIVFKGKALLSGFVYQGPGQTRELERKQKEKEKGEQEPDENCVRKGTFVSSAVFDDPKIEGWYTSQDQGVIENSANRGGIYLKILGRTSEFVKIGGESVEVARLRNILDEVRIRLKTHADIAILPVPDPRLGHVIHFLSDRNLSPAIAESLIGDFNSKVLGFEKIRKWHILENIPRNALGKLVVSECLQSLKPIANGGENG